MNTDFMHAPEWTRQALCAQVDPAPWFQDKGGTSSQAVAVCNRCPVKAECLQLALQHGDQHGIFGGLAPRQRRGMVAKDAA